MKQRVISKTRSRHRCRGTLPGIPEIDVLEPRVLCSAAPNPAAPEPLVAVAASAAHPSHLHRKSVQPTLPLVPGTQASVPQLHSDPTAPARIFLDFSGAAATGWGGQAVPATPAYDSDGNPASFSNTELANIREIWNRVAEKFSPFNLDVTTVDPGAYLKGQTLRMVVGGDGAWTGGTYGGYSIPGGFQSSTPTSWIFPANLNGGDPHYVAEAIAHEAGHNFGLEHQSVFSGSTKLGEYNSGTNQQAPIMGRSYYSQRGVWWVGQDSAGPVQDDMSVIAGADNGFGYRPQDHGQSIATADPLTTIGGILRGSGVISTTSDADFFAFTAPQPSTVTFTANVAQFGPMLHLKLVLLDSSGAVIQTADSNSLGQTLSADLPAGAYRIEVASHGDYGDLGQYSLSGVVANRVDARQGAMSTASSDASGLVARVADSRVRLNWSGGWSRGSRIVVERSTDSGATWSQVSSLRGNATSLTDSIKRAARGTVCCYRLVATGSKTLNPSNAVVCAASKTISK
jgi:hypothetical protein